MGSDDQRFQNATQYEIAYHLLLHVASVEGKNINRSGTGADAADRKYVLDTFVECLKATQNHRPGQK